MTKLNLKFLIVFSAIAGSINSYSINADEQNNYWQNSDNINANKITDNTNKARENFHFNNVIRSFSDFNENKPNITADQIYLIKKSSNLVNSFSLGSNNIINCNNYIYFYCLRYEFFTNIIRNNNYIKSKNAYNNFLTCIDICYNGHEIDEFQYKSILEYIIYTNVNDLINYLFIQYNKSNKNSYSIHEFWTKLLNNPKPFFTNIPQDISYLRTKYENTIYIINQAIKYLTLIKYEHYKKSFNIDFNETKEQYDNLSKQISNEIMDKIIMKSIVDNITNRIKTAEIFPIKDTTEALILLQKNDTSKNRISQEFDVNN